MKHKTSGIRARSATTQCSNIKFIIPTVALLDSGSQLTSIQELLVKDLRQKREKYSLTIQSMNSELTRQSRCVSLEVMSNNLAMNKTLNINGAWAVD